MRVHIDLDAQLVSQVDQIAGARGRSAFVRSAVERALRQELRWASIEAAAGSIEDGIHEWDDDPADWVHAQRTGDPRRTG